LKLLLAEYRVASIALGRLIKPCYTGIRYTYISMKKYQKVNVEIDNKKMH